MLHWVVTKLHLRYRLWRRKNYRLHFWRINLASGCQILSAQVLLDIPGEESFISNLLIIKFYLLPNLLNVKLLIWFIWCYIWDFSLAEWYSNVLKSQQKHNVATAIHSWITIQTWFPLPVSVCSLASHWVSLDTAKEYMGWSQLKSLSSSKCALLVVQFLYFLLGWAMYALPAPHWTGWLKKSMLFVNCLRDPNDSLVQLSYLRPRLPSSLPGVEISLAFFVIHYSWAHCWVGGCVCVLGFFSLLWALLHCGLGHSGPVEQWKKRLWVPSSKSSLQVVVLISLFLMLEKHIRIKLFVILNYFNNCTIHTIQLLHCASSFKYIRALNLAQH